MSYDIMVFNHLKVPCESGRLHQWFHAHMENDAILGQPTDLFDTFLKKIKIFFPPINDCPKDRLEYACDYEVHEDFVYMCFGYSVAKEAHDIVKRRAKICDLGFWDVSQSFDRTFPVTLPADRWPMVIKAKWIKYGGDYVHCYEEIRKVLIQMKTIGRSRVCLTDRHENDIQAAGYKDTFIVEMRKYIDATTCQYLRTDLKNEVSAGDTVVSVDNYNMTVPKSQILTKNQVCLLFQKFAGEIVPDDWNVFWQEIEI